MISKGRFDAIEEAASGGKPDSNLPILLKIYANVPPEAKLIKTPQGISANWMINRGSLTTILFVRLSRSARTSLGILPGNVKKFIDDFVADGPPPGYQGECPAAQAGRRRPALPDLNDDTLVLPADPKNTDRSLTCYTLGMGHGDSVTNCN